MQHVNRFDLIKQSSTVTGRWVAAARIVLTVEYIDMTLQF